MQGIRASYTPTCTRLIRHHTIHRHRLTQTPRCTLPHPVAICQPPAAPIPSAPVCPTYVFSDVEGECKSYWSTEPGPHVHMPTHTHVTQPPISDDIPPLTTSAPTTAVKHRHIPRTSSATLACHLTRCQPDQRRMRIPNAVIPTAVEYRPRDSRSRPP